MQTTPRLILVGSLAALVFAFSATVAGATTVEDILKFKAGKTPLSDDLLIALIESDGSVFRLTGEDVLVLKGKGLSDKLLVAMLKTATKARPAVVDPPTEVAEAWTPLPGAVYVPLTSPSVSPVVLNVSQQVEQKVVHPSPARSDRTVYVPVAVPVAVPYVPRPRPEPAAPVYWGFGGQLRPDTWKPAPDTKDKPGAKPDPKKPGGGR
jgi:hypothetical protein